MNFLPRARERRMGPDNITVEIHGLSEYIKNEAFKGWASIENAIHRSRPAAGEE